MNKQDFLNTLKTKLNLISESEREDILMEYGSYIDDKVASGVSEEEAVEGFGNIDELASEILEAYKINTDSKSKMDKTLDNAYKKSEDILSRFGSLSLNDIFHLLFDAFIVLILIYVGKWIVVDLLGGMILGLIFGIVSDIKFFSYIRDGLDAILTIGYAILALFYFYSVMSRRVNRYRNKASMRQTGVINDMKETWNEESNKFVKKDMNSNIPPVPNQEKPLYHERVNTPKDDSHVWHIIAKIFIVLIMIPTICTLIGFAIAFFVMIYFLVTQQFYSIGLLILSLGLIGCAISFLWLLIHLWPKKEVSSHA